MKHKNRLALMGIAATLGLGAVAAVTLQLSKTLFTGDTSASAEAGRPEGWRPAVDAGPFPSQGPIPPSPVVFRELPLASEDPLLSNLEPRPPRDQRPDMPISEAEAEVLRELSRRLPPQPGVQVIESAPAGDPPPAIDRAFDSINFDDGGASVPPDPEMAVGPNHVIAVVNSMIEIYDRDGNTVSGPTQSDTFFSGVPGCSGTFDPNVLYDEREDRFFIGYDSSSGPDTDNGYCLAATATPDPTGTWNRFSFDASANPGDFFDFPHAGVGDVAIFMGANIFPEGGSGNPFHADVWAIDKFAMYAGDPLPMPVRKTLDDGDGSSPDTPQPMNAHGWANGTWPGEPHYILAECQFDGTNMCIWSWDDPFGADNFNLVGQIDLNAETGVTGGFPLDTPQQGGDDLQGNDFRPQDAEYRNGSIFMTQTVACNPGGGSVNCARWAEIDPTQPSFVQGGVFASDGEFRTFPDAAVNDCGDVVIGYTKSSPDMFPGVYYTGRLADDPPGTLRLEAELKAGEVTYTSFDTPPHRWGDYTGATSDPAGDLLWYLGEYSRDNTSTTSKWGNHIGAFDSGCQLLAEVFFVDGFETPPPL